MAEDAARRRRRWLRRLIFIIVAGATFTGSYFWGRHVEPPPKELDAERVALLTGATEPPQRSDGKITYWRVRRGDETLYAAESASASPDILGYGGPFDLLVVVDASGNLDRVILVRHDETPSYVENVGDFLSSFTGLPATAPLEPGRDVDAITRATVTSEAFAAATRVTGRTILNAALGRDVPLEGRKGEWDWPWALTAAAFFGAALWARRRPREWVRVFFAAAAVGVLGFWAGRFISIGDVGRLVLWKFPPFGPRLSVYILLGGGAVLALIFGNIYCGWLCPFGALAEILHKLPLKKLTVAPELARRLSGLRFIILCVVVATIIATRDLGAAAYEPFDDLFAYGAAGMSLLFLVAILAASVFHYRFFCRYLCAAGALLGEVAATGRPPPRLECRECGECAKVCPTAAVIVNREVIDAALCVECGRCRRGCEAEKQAAGNRAKDF
jgi:NosR/NirI family nitrous oxide reductase transcriptional regulator